jgi:hypothetical protein
MIKKDFVTEYEIQSGIVIDGVRFSYVGMDECEILNDDNEVISIKVFCFSNPIKEIEELIFND